METYSFGEGKYEFSQTLGAPTSLKDRTGRRKWVMHVRRTCQFKGIWTAKIEHYPDDTLSNLWACDVKIQLNVTNYLNKTYTKNAYFCFSNNSLCVELGNIITMTDPPVYVDLRCRKCQFVLDIQIKKAIGIQSFQKLNFSSLRNIDSDVRLIVGDRELFVDRYALLPFSPVFREIFNNSRNNDEHEIKDITLESVLDFLRLLYGQKPELTDRNIKDILTLCNRYEVSFLVAHCEDVLVKTDKITIAEKLDVAEFFILSKLQEMALKQQEIEYKEEQDTINKRQSTSQIIQKLHQIINSR